MAGGDVIPYAPATSVIPARRSTAPPSPTVDRAVQDASIARPAALPVGDPAVWRARAQPLAAGIWIVRPPLTPRLGIERDDALRRCREIEHAADHQRGGLERRRAPRVARAGAVASLLELARVIRPRAREPRDVAAIDLGERGEAHPAGIVAVAAPFVAAAALRGSRRARRAACARGESAAQREERASMHAGNNRAARGGRQVGLPAVRRARMFGALRHAPQ